MKNFRTYQIAVAFYRLAAALRLPCHLQGQLSRAASSVALNLAEGAGRTGRRDQKRFYTIAYASLKECQAIRDLAVIENGNIRCLADKLGVHLYRLIQSRLS